MGDIAQVDRRSVDRLDRKVVEVVQFLRTAIELDVVFERADLFRARRQDQVLREDRIGHILRRQPAGAQRLRIQVDDDLAVLAAVR